MIAPKDFLSNRLLGSGRQPTQTCTMHGRMRHAKAPAVIFFALVVLALAAMLRGWGTLYFGSVISDLTEQFYLWRTFIGRWLSRGTVPYWNPHVFGGYPVIEMQQAFPLHPVAVLTALIADVRLGVVAWMAGLVALAAISSYVAFRYLFGLSGWASLVGSTAYVFGGVFATRIAAAHFTVVAPLAVWPLPSVRCGKRVGWCSRRALACSRGESTLRHNRMAHPLMCCRGGECLRRSRRGLSNTSFICSTLSLCAPSWQPPGEPGVYGGRRSDSAGSGAALSAPQWLPTLFYLPYSSRAGASQMLLRPPSIAKTSDRASAVVPAGRRCTEPASPFEKRLGDRRLSRCACAGSAGATILRAVLPAGGRDRTRHRVAAGVVLLGLYLCYGDGCPASPVFASR